MHFSIFILPLTLALSAVAEKPLPRGLVPARRALQARDEDADLVCGKNYVDCKEGWCCSSGQTCTTTDLLNIPVCKDPNSTEDIAFGSGIVAATPFANIGEKIASMTRDFGGAVESGFAEASDVASSVRADVTSAASAIDAKITSAASEVKENVSDVVDVASSIRAKITSAISGAADALESATGTGSPAQATETGAAAVVGAGGVGAVGVMAMLGWLVM